MSETIDQTWEQELVARGIALGEARGEALGELRARREDLRALLEARFGSLPTALIERIEATEDMDRLRGAVRRIMQIQSLDELDL